MANGPQKIQYGRLEKLVTGIVFLFLIPLRFSQSQYLPTLQSVDTKSFLFYVPFEH